MFLGLIGGDLTLAFAAAIAAGFAGRRAGRGRALTITAGLVAARLVMAVALLIAGGWPLVSDRVLIGLPVAVVPMVWALVATRKGAENAVAVHTAVAGVFVSTWWQYAPPAPADRSIAVAVSLLLLGAAAGGSALLVRLRAEHRPARAPWLTIAVVVALVGGFLGGARTEADGGDHHHAIDARDWGGGGERTAAPRRVSQFTAPAERAADVAVTLVARRTTIRSNGGSRLDALTFNGVAPGPVIRVRQGQLLEVTLLNENVAEGVTVHWHGIDVPNAEDGVPGLTQDAVRPGGRHVYRFEPDRPGTYWYHTHNSADGTVQRGLFGALIVDPAQQPVPDRFERTIFVHEWPDGTTDLVDTARRQQVAPGRIVYLRLINSSTATQRVDTAGTPLVVAALDGNPIDGATELPAGTAFELAAGGRYDLTFTMPDRPVTIRGDGDAVTVLSPGGDAGPAAAGDGPLFDPAGYGTRPAQPPLKGRYDRDFTLILEDGFALQDGIPTYGTLMNGRLVPHVPTLMVADGDLVHVRIVNRSMDDHPMHLHGHRVLVQRRGGEPTTGSPWWTDTLNVAPGQVFDVVFRADNPGVWMDHCHNLEHAANGMIMNLAYAGVNT
ncbi:hypothetical protein Val02_71110 [Virgisporangium aliadipatigenens]|uniref:Uncharacterized protein n=1 Tax=Virgisporangium aliadipatigenens TaxID=741659 RepID=A0A8J3YUT0_9ACTN|nr:multicopper oxidase family protein [Virgisporangium aliadipatigenens]GIJ50225.1 hypothetical protein Val02_71110 [Virgisporangium aliadipatigenens]